MTNDLQQAIADEKTLWGLRYSEFLGVLIMLIPVIISIIDFPTKSSWNIFKGTTSLTPDITCAIFAAAFYFALIVRFPIFLNRNLGESVISSIRAFLNCWATAALISPIASAGNKEVTILMFSFNSFTLLLIAVIFTWLGEKTVAGYSWLLFVVAAVSQWETVAKAMGGWGSVYVLTFSISLFLQVRNFSNVKDFVQDVRGNTTKYTSKVGETVHTAMEDASHRGQQAVDLAKQVVSTVTPIKLNTNNNQQIHANSAVEQRQALPEPNVDNALEKAWK